MSRQEETSSKPLSFQVPLAPLVALAAGLVALLAAPSYGAGLIGLAALALLWAWTHDKDAFKVKKEMSPEEKRRVQEHLSRYS